MAEHDAELRKWVKWGAAIHGEIHNDRKGRFPDGMMVKTSKVVKIEGDILTTKNTKYLLVDPA